jgi:hypothetical protein
MEVMITPTGGTGVYKENERFGDQWVKANKAKRVQLTLSTNAKWSDFEKVMIAAAGIARLGGEVILFIGHGGAAGSSQQADTSFDTIPEPGKFSEHKHKIEFVKLKGAMGASTVEGDKLKPKPPNTDSVLKSLDAPKYLTLVKLGRLFKKNRVKQFTVLSCNVGKDTAFGYLIANLMQTPTRFYQNKAAAVEESNKQILVWILAKENDRESGKPKAGTKDYDLAFHEVPTYKEKKFDPDPERE